MTSRTGIERAVSRDIWGALRDSVRRRGDVGLRGRRWENVALARGGLRR
jgi:hypothetical protein